eukprot:1300327-Amphidinium_carterae.1
MEIIERANIIKARSFSMNQQNVSSPPKKGGGISDCTEALRLKPPTIGKVPLRLSLSLAFSQISDHRLTIAQSPSAALVLQSWCVCVCVCSTGEQDRTVHKQLNNSTTVFVRVASRHYYQFSMTTKHSRECKNSFILLQKTKSTQDGPRTPPNQT